MIGGTLALTQKRLHHFVLAILITAMALRSARALPLSALLLLPIANAAITRWLADSAAVSPARAGTFLAYWPTTSARWTPLPRPCARRRWCSWRRSTSCPPPGFLPTQFPVAAYPHIPAGARLFAPDKFGGYLIYRSNGTLKVFFDGRSDLYGADFLKQYSRLVQVRPGWREYWDSFHFTHALLPADAPLLPALEQLGWRPLYSDKTATLLAFGGT